MCDRCGNAAGTLRELHRFPEDPGAAEITSEYVCDGCLTRVERMFSDAVPSHDTQLMAVCLGMSDKINGLYRLHCERTGKSELGDLEGVLNG